MPDNTKEPDGWKPISGIDALKEQHPDWSDEQCAAEAQRLFDDSIRAKFDTADPKKKKKTQTTPPKAKKPAQPPGAAPSKSPSKVIHSDGADPSNPDLSTSHNVSRETKRERVAPQAKKKGTNAPSSQPGTAKDRAKGGIAPRRTRKASLPILRDEEDDEAEQDAQGDPNAIEHDLILSGLTPRAERFCLLYVTNGFNASKAARDAGYSKKTAVSQASRLLTNVKVRHYIKDLQLQAAAKCGLTPERVMQEMMAMALVNTRDFFSRDEAGNAYFDLDRALDSPYFAGLEGFEVVQMEPAISTDADGEPQVREVIKFKPKTNKTKNLENLARIFRMFGDDADMTIEGLTKLILRLESEHEQKLALLQMRQGGMSPLPVIEAVRPGDGDGEDAE